MKKGVFIFIGVIILLAAGVLGFITYSYFDSKKNLANDVETYKEDTETREILIAFIDLEDDEKNTNFFKTKDFSLDIISYASIESYINIKVNNRVIYNTDFHATKFRVYQLGNSYFIEFVNGKNDCETKEVVILNNKGKISKIFKEKIDDWLSPLDVPTLSAISYNNDTITVTYKSCSKCEPDNKIGYTYTYSLETFKELDKKEVICESNT